jgi:hypothetical protein
MKCCIAFDSMPWILNNNRLMINTRFENVPLAITLDCCNMHHINGNQLCSLFVNIFDL